MRKKGEGNEVNVLMVKKTDTSKNENSDTLVLSMFSLTHYFNFNSSEVIKILGEDNHN